MVERIDYYFCFKLILETKKKFHDISWKRRRRKFKDITDIIVNVRVYFIVNR